mmetsp:Transcript_39264/g.89200  ORF Transcript_39264/g.89200 Transcript_39264/m.89200 type:complete len:118 (-) Transcript_39264:374-727(-)
MPDERGWMPIGTLRRLVLIQLLLVLVLALWSVTACAWVPTTHLNPSGVQVSGVQVQLAARRAGCGPLLASPLLLRFGRHIKGVDQTRARARQAHTSLWPVFRQEKTALDGNHRTRHS